MAFVGLRQMPFLVIMWLRSWTKLLMSQRKILWRLLRKERLLMGKGSNPNSLKGLKIGWDNSELRKNPLNHKICLICNKNFIRRGKKKFTAKCCSRECIRIYRTGIPSPKKGIFNKIQKSCMACNKKFEVYPSEIRKNAGKFCSIKCRTKLWKGKNHPLYKATNRSD